MNLPLTDASHQHPVHGEGLKNEVLIAFSVALGQELDALGYTPPPGRTGALAKDVGLGRTQAYRLLKGMSTPSMEFLSSLRAMGVSLDRILDHLSRAQPQTIKLMINGNCWPVEVLKCPPGVACAAAAVPRETGDLFDLVTVAPGHSVPAKSLPIQSLQFVVRDTLAIVEDDPSTLTLLEKQMSNAFQVVPFENATSLVEYAAGLSTFKAFLLDWRLPDMQGEVLVKLIRQRSSVPIFILTGDTTASASIARALEYPNIHHVSKPADEIILIKRIANAIRG